MKQEEWKELTEVKETNKGNNYLPAIFYHFWSNKNSDTSGSCDWSHWWKRAKILTVGSPLNSFLSSFFLYHPHRRILHRRISLFHLTSYPRFAILSFLSWPLLSLHSNHNKLFFLYFSLSIAFPSVFVKIHSHLVVRIDDEQSDSFIFLLRLSFFFLFFLVTGLRFKPTVDTS